MNHFEEEAWVDYLRQLVSAPRAAVMQQHLQTGCAHCENLNRAWQEILDVFSRDGDYNPPESSVRIVKAAFDIPKKVPFLQYATNLARAFAQCGGNALASAPATAGPRQDK